MLRYQEKSFIISVCSYSLVTFVADFIIYLIVYLLKVNVENPSLHTYIDGRLLPYLPVATLGTFFEYS